MPAQHANPLIEQLIQPRVLHQVAVGDGVDHVLPEAQELLDLLLA